MEREVLFDKLNASFSSEFFLVLSLSLANVGNDVEAELSQVKRIVILILDDVEKNVDDTFLCKLKLKVLKLRAVQ